MAQSFTKGADPAKNTMNTKRGLRKNGGKHKGKHKRNTQTNKNKSHMC